MASLTTETALLPLLGRKDEATAAKKTRADPKDPPEAQSKAGGPEGPPAVVFSEVKPCGLRLSCRRVRRGS